VSCQSGLVHADLGKAKMTKKRIVQVGLGGWGWSWVDIVIGSPQWELVGIVDRDRGVLNRAIQLHGLDPAAAFTSLEECGAAVRADAALIVVPPEWHAAVTCEAAALGWHCLVEKPIADTVADARLMIEATRRHGVTLMISQNYRFRRAAETVRRLVADGAVGEIGLAYIMFQKAPPFTGFRTTMQQPLITDMAVHHFDQIRGLLNLEAASMSATTCNPSWSWFEGDAVANVVFNMTNGARVIYTGSWVSRGWETTWDGDWRIQGSEGEIHWANNRVSLFPRDIFKSVFRPGAQEREGKLDIDLVKLDHEDRSASLAEFFSALNEGRVPVTSGSDNLHSLAMVLGAQQSASTGASVSLAQLLADGAPVT
jgi:predicted dehydrogenase